MATKDGNNAVPSSQLSNTDKNNEQIRVLVTGLTSQDMFKDTTPVRGKLKNNRRARKLTTEQTVFSLVAAITEEVQTDEQDLIQSEQSPVNNDRNDEMASSLTHNQLI